MNILELKGVTKRYKNFQLGPLDLALPQGCIMGYIGENGAGKSTTIKLILGLIKADQGSVLFKGKKLENENHELKEKIGFVFDDLYLPPDMKVKQTDAFNSMIYRDWEPQTFARLLDLFRLDRNKKMKELSRGMKMKLSLALALSHHAELLLLDEATSGLDPVFRDEILDLLLEFIQDETHSVLISSHILSDLEKAADYIAFLHEGKTVFCEEKDLLKEKYAICTPSPEEEESLPHDAVIGQRRHRFGVEMLVERGRMPAGIELQPVTIEEIMLFMIKGEKE